MNDNKVKKDLSSNEESIDETELSKVSGGVKDGFINEDNVGTIEYYNSPSEVVYKYDLGEHVKVWYVSNSKKYVLSGFICNRRVEFKLGRNAYIDVYQVGLNNDKADPNDIYPQSDRYYDREHFINE